MFPRILLCLFLMVQCNITQAQWAQTAGPYGGTIHRFVEADGAVIALTYGGLFILNSTEKQWLASSDGLRNKDVRDLVTLGDSWLVATSLAGVYRSTDMGKSWTPSSKGLPAQEIAGSTWYGAGPFVMIDGTMLVGTSGVYSSRDTGATWTSSGIGLQDSTVYGGIIRPFAFLKAHPYVFAASQSHGLYRSSDAGRLWSPCSDGLFDSASSSYQSIKSICSIDSTIYVGTSRRGIFESTDMGRSWNHVSGGLLYARTVTSLTAMGDTLFAGTEGLGVFRSTDRARTWSRYGLDSFYVATVWAHGGIVYAGGYGEGVFISPATAANWQELNEGLIALQINCFTRFGPNVIAGTDNGAYRSQDNGRTWQHYGLGAKPVNCLTVADGDLYAGTDGGVHGSVFVSKDSSASWTSMGLGLPPVNCLAVLDSLIFAGTWGGGVMLSSDGGQHWRAVNTGLNPDYVWSFLVMGKDLYTSIQGDGVFLFDRAGQSWAPRNLGLQTTVTSLAAIDSTLFASSEGVFRSDDHGQSWTMLDTGPPPWQKLVWTLAAEGKSIVAGTSEGMLVSRDAGSTWVRSMGGLFNIPYEADIVSAIILKDTLLAGTRNTGVWRTALAETATPVETSHNHMAEVYQLEQNYPNPFNPTTTIRYNLPKRGHIELTVYNALGQRIAVLWDGEQEAGTHESNFDGAGLPSGVYFYRLDAGPYKRTQKLILVK
jgi:hypothetical protein